MPVGHAVTATRVLFGTSELSVSVGFVSAGSVVVAEAAGVEAADAVGPGGVAGASTSSTRATTSVGVAAARSDATNAGLTNARARLDSSFMCSEPAPSGAAIRNTRSAGPSGAPKSTFGDRRAKPRDAVAIDASRQCGMAMPPGRPVADWDSRARAAALSASTSDVRPSAASRCASASMTASLVVPRSASSAISSGLMIAGAEPARIVGWDMTFP